MDRRGFFGAIGGLIAAACGSSTADAGRFTHIPARLFRTATFTGYLPGSIIRVKSGMKYKPGPLEAVTPALKVYIFGTSP